ncbi:hypothetical protein DK59_2544 [Brucella abortus bv. 4 str. 292]|nr:hypothetical protein DK47_3026 [Brucella abortus 2308]KFJ59604.1 hypothetical protein DK59_2544 [Brucella abortus bv. 4 str. 292]
MVRFFQQIDSGHDHITICQTSPPFLMNIANGELIWERGTALQYQARAVLDHYCITGRIEPGCMAAQIIRPAQSQSHCIRSDFCPPALDQFKYQCEAGNRLGIFRRWLSRTVESLPLRASVWISCIHC